MFHSLTVLHERDDCVRNEADSLTVLQGEKLEHREYHQRAKNDKKQDCETPAVSLAKSSQAPHLAKVRT